MDKDFDWMNVGKQMPFKTPEGFFERMQAETMARIEAEKRRKKIYRLKVGFATILSAAAIWCGVMFFFQTNAPVSSSTEVNNELLANVDDPMDIYIQQLSDEELEEWIEFSENDIFYELTTEIEEYEED